MPKTIKSKTNIWTRIKVILSAVTVIYIFIYINIQVAVFNLFLREFFYSILGLLELEASLPPYVLQLNIVPPRRLTTTKDGYMKRKYREEKRLEDIHAVRIDACFFISSSSSSSSNFLLLSISISNFFLLN